jgi:hypothetical protein
MTKSKLILTLSVGAIVFAAVSFAAMPIGWREAQAKDMVVAADDQAGDDEQAGQDAQAGDDDQAGEDAGADGSAKMGQDEGTHIGDEQGSAPENDTQKIDQPARANPTTSNAPDEGDDVMPPEEDSDEQPE